MRPCPDQEHEKVLAFYPTSAALPIRAAIVGLAQAFSTFSSSFTAQVPALHSVEPAMTILVPFPLHHSSPLHHHFTTDSSLRAHICTKNSNGLKQILTLQTSCSRPMAAIVPAGPCGSWSVNCGGGPCWRPNPTSGSLPWSASHGPGPAAATHHYQPH